MSSKELRRAGGLARVEKEGLNLVNAAAILGLSYRQTKRVEKEGLNLVNAAAILGLSYRQTKRVWRRYQEEGAEGLWHRSVGGEPGRKKSKKFRLKVLRLVRQKYSGEVGERFGPTLAAEHLGSEDGI